MLFKPVLLYGCLFPSAIFALVHLPRQDYYCFSKPQRRELQAVQFAAGSYAQSYRVPTGLDGSRLQWGGAVISDPTPGSVTTISATFVVPKVFESDSGLSKNEVFIGIDDDQCTTGSVAVGIDAYIASDGEASYSFVYKHNGIIAAGSNLKVSAGDQIMFSIATRGPTVAVAKIENMSNQGCTDSHEFQDVLLCRQTAKWAVSASRDGSPLAKFDQVKFSYPFASGPSTSEPYPLSAATPYNSTNGLISTSIDQSSITVKYAGS